MDNGNTVFAPEDEILLTIYYVQKMYSELRNKGPLPNPEERKKILDRARMVLHNARQTIARCDASQNKARTQKWFLSPGTPVQGQTAYHLSAMAATGGFATERVALNA